MDYKMMMGDKFGDKMLGGKYMGGKLGDKYMKDVKYADKPDKTILHRFTLDMQAWAEVH